MLGVGVTYMKPSSPLVATNKKHKMDLAPFKLPSAGEDQKSAYITAIRGDAPFDYEYFDGVDFSKYCFPTDASYVENSGKLFQPVIPTKMLTERQAAAILERAGKREKNIPSKPNLDFDAKDKNSKEYIPAKTVVVADYIILEKVENAAHLDISLPEIEQPQDDLSSELEKQIYAAQKKKGK